LLPTPQFSAAQQVAQLCLVYLQVPTDDDEYQLLSLPQVLSLREAECVEHRLQRLARRHADEGSHVGDRLAAGGGDGARFLRRLGLDRGQPELGPLDVGRVAAGWAADDGIFPVGVGQHELVGVGTAHHSCVSLDGNRVEVAAGEDALIG
jgi:hypothetical protein